MQTMNPIRPKMQVLVVRPKEPKDQTLWRHSWTDSMDSFDGTLQIVERVYEGEYFYLVGSIYVFNFEWLEPMWKPGDKVVVRKPPDVNEAPTWVSASAMDAFDGSHATVEVAVRSGSFVLTFLKEGGHFSYRSSWLEPVSFKSHFAVAANGDKRCSCGGPTKDLQLFSSVVKICANCGKDK